jgi:hypothetical protein
VGEKSRRFSGRGAARSRLTVCFASSCSPSFGPALHMESKRCFANVPWRLAGWLIVSPFLISTASLIPPG